MKNYNFLLIILLGTILSNCGNQKKSENSLFTFDNAKFKAQYQTQESVELGIINANSKKVDSVVYYNNNLKIGSKKGLEKLVFNLNNQKFGHQNIKAAVYYDGEYAEVFTTIELVSNVQPKLLHYKIVNTYPHDTLAYTQGLEFYRDTLYEGTGQYGTSYLRKTDYRTGKVYKEVKLAEQFFGEGITVLNNKVYQLTWKNNEGYVYNADNFKKEKTFQYPKQMEGWGLTSDGKVLYMTDSSETIHILNPETFKELNHINVYSLSATVPSLNELEWINGKIYGNVYQKDAIAIINPTTGAVEGIINLVDLKKKITQLANTDVLNGIAYNPKTKTIFVTGKNWDKMFEITIGE